jgi:hypothetical protein
MTCSHNAIPKSVTAGDDQSLLNFTNQAPKFGCDNKIAKFNCRISGMSAAHQTVTAFEQRIVGFGPSNESRGYDAKYFRI